MNNRRLLSILIVLAIFFGWHCGYEKNAPNEIVGTWETTAPQYTDRFITIDIDTITFGIGGGNVEIYTIKKIEKTSAEGSILYTIYYENGDGVWYKFAFYYSSANGGEFRKKNQQQIVWEKRSNH
jgi:hypothetical protein